MLLLGTLLSLTRELVPRVHSLAPSLAYTPSKPTQGWWKNLQNRDHPVPLLSGTSESPLHGGPFQKLLRDPQPCGRRPHSADSQVEGGPSTLSRPTSLLLEQGGEHSWQEPVLRDQGPSDDWLQETHPRVPPPKPGAPQPGEGHGGGRWPQRQLQYSRSMLAISSSSAQS